MNKTDLINVIVNKTNLSKNQANTAVNVIINSIIHTLGKGGKVMFSGLGTFQVVERAPRIGRNPKTGEEIDIPATKTVTFKAGKALKDVVNAYDNILE